MRGPYFVQCAVATSATSGTVTNAMSLSAAAARGVDIVRIEAAVEGAPNSVDGSIRVDLYNTTAATPNIALTIANRDAGSGASTVQSTASSSPTAVTTTGQPVCTIEFNQRATGLWIPERVGAEIGMAGAAVYVAQITQIGIGAAMTIRLGVTFYE